MLDRLLWWIWVKYAARKLVRELSNDRPWPLPRKRQRIVAGKSTARQVGIEEIRAALRAEEAGKAVFQSRADLDYVRAVAPLFKEAAERRRINRQRKAEGVPIPIADTKPIGLASRVH